DVADHSAPVDLDRGRPGRAGGVHQVRAAGEVQGARPQADARGEEGGRRMRWLALLALPALLPAAPALGGSVAGTVRVERIPAKARALTIAKDATVCGREAAGEALIVAADRGLANAVVWLAGVK